MKSRYASSLLIAFVFVLLLCGCTGAGSSMTSLVKQLKGDPATVSVNLTTIYGTLKFVRTNPGTNTETAVTPDGTVTVKRP
jgi:hypothetical protein